MPSCPRLQGLCPCSGLHPERPFPLVLAAAASSPPHRPSPPTPAPPPQGVPLARSHAAVDGGAVPSWEGHGCGTALGSLGLWFGSREACGRERVPSPSSLRCPPPDGSHPHRTVTQKASPPPPTWHGPGPGRAGGTQEVLNTGEAVALINLDVSPSMGARRSATL